MQKKLLQIQRPKGNFKRPMPQTLTLGTRFVQSQEELNLF